MPRRKRAKANIGQLVVFEGPDGVGKSTIAAAIAREALARGLLVDLVSFPGAEPGTLGELVYRLHHAPVNLGVAHIVPAAAQALHVAAHLDVIESKIRPAIEAGRLVLLDRFWWSTWVYGTAGRVPSALLRGLIDAERAQWGSLRPTIVFHLRRSRPINRRDNLKWWRRLRKEYDSLSQSEAGSVTVRTINDARSLDVAAFACEQALVELNVFTRVRSPGLWIGATGPFAPSIRLKGADAEARLSAVSDAETGNGTNRPASVFVSHLAPAKPSIVYESYWRFAAERQAVFFRRMAATPPPWTADPVLQKYKFTNAYRASDRASQYLIRNVIYRSDLPSDETEVTFRILLFKLFNKIDTWKLLERTVGPITYAEYSFERFDRVLSGALRSGTPIYSAAYIMPPGGSAFGYPAKHQNHLRLLERMLTDDVPKRLADARSMQRGFDLLREYPTIGDFLAYQFITDINYSEVTSFTEMEFVIPGPGALDGLRKCFLDPGGLNQPELIKFVADIQEAEFERLGLDFKNLWGRRLQLIDCQNLFCEVDKYARVMHPEIAGRSGRTRIKQKYAVHPDGMRFWYPPKWGINHLLPEPSADPAQPGGYQDIEPDLWSDAPCK